MYRLKLAVADTDEIYLNRLCEFINSSDQKNFRAVSFSRMNSLKEYINSGEKIDLILISSELICEQVRNVKGAMPVILSENRQDSCGEYAAIFKYQPVDKILGCLTDLYAEKNRNIGMFKESGHTKVVSVYSPSGGVGKSTVAVNLAIQSALMGREVFYLSIETFCSSTFLLSGKGQKSLSNVLLYLKDKEACLPAKIETAKVRDIKYNLDFFLPPESGAELSELDRECMAALLKSLRLTGKYDLIVADLDSVLSDRTIGVLENSNSIILVVVQELLCNYKTGLMFEEFKRAGLNVEKNIIPVINKYRPDSPVCCNIQSNLKLPLVEDIMLKNERLGFWEFNNNYAGYMFVLAGML